MLPKLRAEESMQAVNRLGVGTGTLVKEDRQRQIQHWQQTANGGVRPRPVRAKAGDLQAMGIGVYVAPKKTSPDS